MKSNNYLIVLLFLFLPLTSFAQGETTALTFWDDPINHPLTPLYAVLFLVGIIVVLILAIAIIMLKVLNTFITNAEKAKAEAAGLPYVAPLSWWRKLDKKLTNAIPIEKEATVMLDHNYDGIKELDNHLPPWWKWLFIGTIAWSVVYLVVYHITDDAPLQEQEYETEVALASENLRKIRGAQPVASIDEATLTYAEDAALISSGQKIFLSNCASCHKEKGEGGIGPNLTDEYWLHGGGVKDIYAVIKNGVAEKGMISWSPILKPEQMRDVSFFIVSIRGTNPPNQKAAQGVIWKEPIKVDSLKMDSVKVQAAL